MNKNNNILIVGGTGFIGYHLSKKLLKKGWEVTSISTKKPNKKRYIKEVKYLFCDIANKQSLKNKIKNYFRYVVNLGGYVDHSNKQKTYKSHFLGCKNLVEILLKNPPESFVQMGSCVEYGRLKSPQKENQRCKPLTIYGKAKLAATKYLLQLNKKNNFPSIIIRLYLAYGPKQDVNRFLPIIIEGCIKDKKFACSEGNQFRDFVHVDDVVNFIIMSLNNKRARGQIFNIGSGKPKKIKDIIKNVKKISNGGKPQFGKIKLRKDEILKIYPSIKKAKKIIKWTPKISFSKGIKNTINSYEK